MSVRSELAARSRDRGNRRYRARGVAGRSDLGAARHPLPSRVVLPTAIPSTEFPVVPSVAPGYRAPEVAPSAAQIVGVTAEPFVGIALQDAIAMALLKNNSSESGRFGFERADRALPRRSRRRGTSMLRCSWGPRRTSRCCRRRISSSGPARWERVTNTDRLTDTPEP